MKQRTHARVTSYRSLVFSPIRVEYTANRSCCIPAKLFALLLKQRQGKREKKWSAVASHFMLPARVSLSVPCQHFWPSPCQLHLLYHVLFLSHRHTIIFAHISVCVCDEGVLVRRRSRAKSKATSGRAGVCCRKQLPLTVSASHPGLTAVRNMRPPETSVLGKKDRAAHISHHFLSLLPLSPSL